MWDQEVLPYHITPLLTVLRWSGRRSSRRSFPSTRKTNLGLRIFRVKGTELPVIFPPTLRGVGEILKRSSTRVDHSPLDSPLTSRLPTPTYGSSVVRTLTYGVGSQPSFRNHRSVGSCIVPVTIRLDPRVVSLGGDFNYWWTDVNDHWSTTPRSPISHPVPEFCREVRGET